MARLSAKNLTVPQMKANAAGMKAQIATKPKGDPTGMGLKGQALTGATVNRKSGGMAKGSREGSVIKAKDGKWIQKAIKKPGALRSSLGVKAGKDIPAKKLNTAAKKKWKLGQRARLAKTLKSFA